jgi:hypothetical protein
MDAIQNRPRTRLVSFILEAAKLVGIAIACLLVVAAVVIFSAKTGIKVPERWIGLTFWTCFLLWFVFQQHKRNVRHLRFWLVLAAFLTVHVTVFAVVLRAYAAWRTIWFMFVIVIEGPLVLLALQNVIHPRRNRKHV